MGFRARKSFKIAPGVRMTVTPRGVGVSAGVKGARISRGANGRVTRTLSIPGTGVSHVASRSSGGRTVRSAPVPAQVAAMPTPGFTAPRWEKELHKALVVAQDPTKITDVATRHPEARPHGALFEALFGAMPAGDTDRARSLLAWVFDIGFDPMQDAFCRKYLSRAAVTLDIAVGVSAQLPIDRDVIGLVLAEVLQEAGDLAGAIDVVEQLEPSTVAAVSLAELYGQTGRWDQVMALTEGISNVDEPSVYLLIQRGAALREQGFYEGAREALKEAMRVRSRPAELRQQALVERAETYSCQGKASMARKDLEKVLAENSQYPGIRERLASL